LMVGNNSEIICLVLVDRWFQDDYLLNRWAKKAGGLTW